jgi:uncharacterized protein involved in exopolysaccharide biosynthesis
MDGVMERKDIKALTRLIKKERKVGKQLRQALRSDLEKVPQLSVKYRALTRQMDELLPPATDPLIDL